VGPRPTLPYQVERYDDQQKRRLLVKPGVTGWAQVNGRSALTWPERISLDLWYVDHWSILFDFKILFKTIKVVLAKSNLYKEAEYDPISGEKGYFPGDDEISGEENTNPVNDPEG